MFYIKEPDEEEIENVREMIKKSIELEDDREIWIWRDYLE